MGDLMSGEVTTRNFENTSLLDTPVKDISRVPSEERFRKKE